MTNQKAQRMLSRRDVLKLAGIAAVTLPFATIACAGDEGTDGSTGVLRRSRARLPEPFRIPLSMPPVLKPARRDAATDYYEISQRPGKVEILPGLETDIWGYNGIFPGPTIEARSGRRVVVHHRNELPVPTVVHLHGGKTPPADDGYPIDMLLPVGGWAAEHSGHTVSGQLSHGERDYVYPLDQPAATLWYHDHRMDFTGPQVYRGLAGFHLVHDDEEDALPLPRGDRDIPLMLCDRSFAEDGSLLYPSFDPSLRGTPGVGDDFMQGVMGDVILVNGAPWPFLEVTNTRYRFRLLNASNARRYRLALDPMPRGGQAFVQVGSDVGLLDRPVSHQQIEIAQAERFDVVVDFSAYPIGTQVTLTNQLGSGTTSRVMRFHVTREAKEDSTVPSRLIESRRLTRSDAVATRTLRFARGAHGPSGRRGTVWTINDQTFDPGRVDAQLRLGTTEVWRLTTNVHHPVHLHLAHFQVLSRGEMAPGPYDAGWKDTIDMRSGETAEIIVRFTGFRGRYVFHCHNLEHEDMAMMGNLEVV